MGLKQRIKERCPEQVWNTARRAVHKKRELVYRAKAKAFAGRMQVYCPNCGLRFRSFVTDSTYLDHPEMFNHERYVRARQDVICPYCGSKPRHRVLALWCDEHKEMLCQSDILVFAPEDCMMLWMEKEGIRCTTADLYQKADLKLDMQATGLLADSYDVILCNHVLEHVDDYRKALHEMFRILRPGGSFICSFPMDPKVEFVYEDPAICTEEERVIHFGQYDHKRVFGAKAGQLLEEAGFRVEIIDGSSYPEEILPINAPADYNLNIFFRCRKPDPGSE